MFVEQALQFEQASRGSQMGAKAQVAQAWGAGSMFNQTNPGHGIERAAFIIRCDVNVAAWARIQGFKVNQQGV